MPALFESLFPGNALPIRLSILSLRLQVTLLSSSYLPSARSASTTWHHSIKSTPSRGFVSSIVPPISCPLKSPRVWSRTWPTMSASTTTRTTLPLLTMQPLCSFRVSRPSGPVTSSLSSSPSGRCPEANRSSGSPVVKLTCPLSMERETSPVRGPSSP
ncbi:hypothetical protein ES703_111555 [subsurface metagenome]